MSKRTPGLYKRPRAGGRHEWHIDKCIRGYGRICESTGTDDEEEANRYLEHRIKEIRNAVTYGVRPKRTFRQAATKYLETYKGKPGISRQATAVKDLDPFIGDKCIDTIYNETFEPYIKARRNPPQPGPGERRRKLHRIGTVNRNLGVARRILNCCARLWRHEETGLTWLAQAPLIQLLEDPDARPPYPIDWNEQRLLLDELAPHLQRIVTVHGQHGIEGPGVVQPAMELGAACPRTGLEWNQAQRLLATAPAEQEQATARGDVKRCSAIHHRGGSSRTSGTRLHVGEHRGRSR
jgi:hypothetical protein